VALGVAEGKTARMSLSVKSLGAADKDSYFALTNPFSPCLPQAVGNQVNYGC